MAGLNLNKKLWRIPQQGMVRGVCAGLAHYLDVPVKLVRVVTVLSIFFGLAFITLVAYIILSFADGSWRISIKRKTAFNCFEV